MTALPASARRRRSSGTSETAASAVAWLGGVSIGDDPFALDEHLRRPAAGGAGGAGGRRRGAARPPGQAGRHPVYSLLGLRRLGPPTSWTVWLGDPDDMARRAEKAAARGFRRLKLKLGGRDGLDLERVRAVRAATDVAAPVRRERVLDARRGARVPAADGARLLRAAAAGRRPRRPRAEAALAAPDLRRRGLPHAGRRRSVRRARARRQHQAREVGRDPRGGQDRPRSAGARARRDARLHGRVRARHRGRRARREPDGPRRPRRQPAARRAIRGPGSRSRAASRCRPTAAGLGVAPA